MLPALVMVAAVRPAALAADRPPECVTVKIVNTNGTRTWVTACGSGPGAEPPIPERYDGKKLITDGAFVVGQAPRKRGRAISPAASVVVNRESAGNPVAAKAPPGSHAPGGASVMRGTAGTGHWIRGYSAISTAWRFAAVG